MTVPGEESFPVRQRGWIFDLVFSLAVLTVSVMAVTRQKPFPSITFFGLGMYSLYSTLRTWSTALTSVRLEGDSVIVVQRDRTTTVYPRSGIACVDETPRSLRIWFDGEEIRNLLLKRRWMNPDDFTKLGTAGCASLAENQARRRSADVAPTGGEPENPA